MWIDCKWERIHPLALDGLASPDVIALQEIQDNNGAADAGIVAADQTAAELIAAITNAGGPAYTYADMVPVRTGTESVHAYRTVRRRPSRPARIRIR